MCRNHVRKWVAVRENDIAHAMRGMLDNEGKVRLRTSDDGALLSLGHPLGTTHTCACFKKEPLAAARRWWKAPRASL